MAVVIYKESDGVFLGSCLGLAFWSLLDAVGQTSATAFPDKESAEEFMATWLDGRPEDVRLVDVVADEHGFASMAACVRAGMPGWLVEDSPVENALPV